jgi:hypothetical protein
VRDGCLHLGPTLAASLQFRDAPTQFVFWDGSGIQRELSLQPGTLALTCFQVPVVLHRDGEPRLVLTDESGTQRETVGFVLDAEASARLFERRSDLVRIDVYGR